MAEEDRFLDASHTGDEQKLSSDVCRVGVRIPPFYPTKPAIWFAQIEGQFAIANITSDATKFYHVISQLEPPYADEVEDIIISPPSTNKYEKLKSELIRRLSASKDKKIKQLLIHEELGERTPSQFLRHLRHLAGQGVPDDFLQSIWASRLPTNTQTIIASQINTPLDDLAELADKIHDVLIPSPHAAACSCASTSTESTYQKQITQMAKQIAALTTKIKNISTDFGRKSRSRDRSRHTRSRTRSHSSYNRHPVCWYHYKFRDRAKMCIKPCDFEKAENNRGRP